MSAPVRIRHRGADPQCAYAVPCWEASCRRCGNVAVRRYWPPFSRVAWLDLLAGSVHHVRYVCGGERMGWASREFAEKWRRDLFCLYKWDERGEYGQPGPHMCDLDPGHDERHVCATCGATR